MASLESLDKILREHEAKIAMLLRFADGVNRKSGLVSERLAILSKRIDALNALASGERENIHNLTVTVKSLYRSVEELARQVVAIGQARDAGGSRR